MRAALTGLLLVAACAGEDTSLGGERLADGYIRYRPASVELQPGETAQYVQWVSAPLDRELDIVDVRGSQGPGGHHAVLYASADVEPAGTTRAWSPGDQLTARFLGGAGGEGVSSGGGLPEGAVLRVPAGSAFYIQSHYLNATDDVIEGTSTVDVKVVEPSPDAIVLSMFVSSTLAVDVPPGLHEQTLSCAVQQDTPMILFVNHIHETGVAVATELRTTDGNVQMLKHDPAWDDEWSTHPNFAVTALDRPLVLPAGASLVTRCNWDNTSGKTLGFPDEMCAFLGFYIGTRDRACANGNWVEL
jgi:hypothetical protein